MDKFELVLLPIQDNNPKTPTYSARSAWLRAIAYFTLCLALGWYFGIPERLVSGPPATAEQVADPLWWLLTLVVTADVFFAYLWYWPRGTLVHGRPRRPLAGLIFGFLWGFCQGQFMLVVYETIGSFGMAITVNIALMFLAWSTWTALWHSRYWDIRVSPEHNIEEWNLRKVLVSHTPFLLLSVTHYALYSNAALFVAWQIIALTTCTLVMRFPAPSDA